VDWSSHFFINAQNNNGTRSKNRQHRRVDAALPFLQAWRHLQVRQINFIGRFRLHASLSSEATGGWTFVNRSVFSATAVRVTPDQSRLSITIRTNYNQDARTVSTVLIHSPVRVAFQK